MKKFIAVLTKDPLLKLTAFLISIAVWFICMNVTDPVVTNSFRVQLRLDNVSMLRNNKKILRNEAALRSTTIYISVKGPKSMLDDLYREQAGLAAYVDFYLAELLNASQFGEPIPTAVQPALPARFAGSLEITGVSPGTVGIELDGIIEKEISVRAVPKGALDEGYIASQPKVYPETVKITGPSITLSKLDYVETEYPLAGHADIEGYFPIKVYNSEGEEEPISDFTLSQNEAHLFVKVNKIARIPVYAPDITGKPEPGSVIVPPRIKWSPDFVEIVGDEAGVNDFRFIKPSPIDVSGHDETFTVTLDLNEYLNAGLYFLVGTDKEVEVTVYIERVITRDFEFPVSAIAMEGLTGEIETDPEAVVLLTVEGPESAVNRLSIDDISGRADLSELEPGEHRIAISFSLPENIADVSEDAFIDVTVNEPAEEEDEIEDE